MELSLSLIFFSLLLQTSFGAVSQIDRIPNGRSIPCPEGAYGCTNGMCLASGHIALDGVTQSCDGTPNFTPNQFGYDYLDQRQTWNYAICTTDSDKDGRTNGDELGDPCCTWTKDSGVAPRRTIDITHPSVETMTSSSPSCLLSGEPSDISVKNVSSSNGDVIIQWDIPSTQCYCGFTVYRKLQSEEDDQYSLVANLSYDAVSFDDADATPSSDYDYLILAVNLAGRSPGKIIPFSTPSQQVPSRIHTITLSADSSHVYVSWDAPRENGSPVLYYIIARNGTVIDNVTVTSYIDVNVMSGQVYEYSIAAGNAYGLGNFSQSFIIKTARASDTPCTNCSSHGTCDGVTDTCSCDPGYVGSDCSIEVTTTGMDAPLTSSFITSSALPLTSSAFL